MEEAGGEEDVVFQRVSGVDRMRGLGEREGVDVETETVS